MTRCSPSFHTSHALYWCSYSGTALLSRIQAQRLTHARKSRDASRATRSESPRCNDTTPHSASKTCSAFPPFPKALAVTVRGFSTKKPVQGHPHCRVPYPTPLTCILCKSNNRASENTYDHIFCPCVPTPYWFKATRHPLRHSKILTRYPTRTAPYTSSVETRPLPRWLPNLTRQVKL